jgi:hypothetical protein
MRQRGAAKANRLEGGREPRGEPPTSNTTSSSTARSAWVTRREVWGFQKQIATLEFPQAGAARSRFVASAIGSPISERSHEACHPNACHPNG